MVKISPETLKEAAKNVNDLMESASPEIKMLLENPNFATGLCLVLHKEITQLRNQLQESKSGNSGQQQPHLDNAAKQSNLKASEGQQGQQPFQNQPESQVNSAFHNQLQEPAQAQKAPERTQQPEKEELFV